MFKLPKERFIAYQVNYNINHQIFKSGSVKIRVESVHNDLCVVNYRNKKGSCFYHNNSIVTSLLSAHQPILEMIPSSRKLISSGGKIPEMFLRAISCGFLGVSPASVLLSSLSLFLSLSISFSLFLSLSLSCSLFLSLSLSFYLFLSLALPFSLFLSLSLSFSLFLSLSLSFYLLLSLALSCSLFLSLALSCSLFLSLSISFSLLRSLSLSFSLFLSSVFITSSAGKGFLPFSFCNCFSCFATSPFYVCTCHRVIM